MIDIFVALLEALAFFLFFSSLVSVLKGGREGEERTVVGGSEVDGILCEAQMFGFCVCVM